jgi:multiple sugar transport system ATP-binding protein
VATFVGSPRINLLPVAVSEGLGGDARVRLGDGSEIETGIAAATLPGAEALTLGLRAECVRVAGPDGARVQGTVEVVERLGERTLVHVALGDGARLVAEDAGLSNVRAGERVGLAIDGRAAHLFDAQGLGHHAREAG